MNFEFSNYLYENQGDLQQKKSVKSIQNSEIPEEINEYLNKKIEFQPKIYYLPNKSYKVKIFFSFFQFFQRIPDWN